MMRKALPVVLSLSLTSCATAPQSQDTQPAEQSSPEFPLTFNSGEPGEMTGEWLKDVYRSGSKLEETCVSYMWGVLDALERWPPRDGQRPFCTDGLSYGTIADGMRSYVAGVDDEEAGRRDAATLVRRAMIERFPCTVGEGSSVEER